MKNIKLFIPLVIFVGLALFLLKGLERDPNALPSALIGEPVPAFSLPDLHSPNAPISEDIFKGHVSLLNVWATWCPSCRVEHPFLVALAEKEAVRIIGMDYKDEDEAARRWLESLGNPYAVTFTDQEGKLGIDLGVFGAPETYLIDKQGIIRAKHVGVVNEQVWQELGAMYRELLTEKMPE
ncbi:MAG: DsbE family thiol:disulfide interchange protein [Porticoccaceae bacterium]|jgi:cytochrome c biogenesis protein CcmG/thiol:disulfide interchange protein DsbE